MKEVSTQVCPHSDEIEAPKQTDARTASNGIWKEISDTRDIVKEVLGSIKKRRMQILGTLLTEMMNAGLLSDTDTVLRLLIAALCTF